LASVEVEYAVEGEVFAGGDVVHQEISLLLIIRGI
jgi:hypothetical protein